MKLTERLAVKDAVGRQSQQEADAEPTSGQHAAPPTGQHPAPADTALPEPTPGALARAVAPAGPTGASRPTGSPPPLLAVPRPAASANPLLDLKERAAQQLFERIGSRLSDPTLTEENLHALAREELTRIVGAEDVALSRAERRQLLDEIGSDVLGFGPLENMLADDEITEIMVNGHDQIYVERAGRISLSPAQFSSDGQLRRVIERIVSGVGRRIDESSPLVDARLPDGSRVNAVIPPLAVNGPSLTIRKFARTPLTAADLGRMGSLPAPVAAVLQAAVQGRLNVLVSGGTGTGKTTLLNVLSSYIPEGQRIITIEDAVELQLQQRHVVRLESRPPNIEGKGEVTIRDLVRNALRMRPDRIVIGEVRGAESLDMLQAMNTGHEGSISTIHANSPRDAVSRLETLVLMAGMELPLRAVREQIASALDLIVQIARLKDGTRRITHVAEVHGMEGEVVTLQDVFVFDYGAGTDDTGRFLGEAIATGVRPRFADQLADLGIQLPPDLLTPPTPLKTRGRA